MSTAWAEALLRASLQGGLAILLVFGFLRLFPRIPGSVQVWMWRAVALKLLLGVVAPITVYMGVIDGTAAETASQLPNAILILSAICFATAAISLIGDWRKVAALGKGGVQVELPIFTSLCERLAIRQVPRVLLRSDIDRPMLTGIRRPTIHLSANLDPEAREMVLAHELAHIKRRDLLWEWLFIAVDAIFAFHPLVWLLKREHRLAQESACDSMALEAARATPTRYSRMLLELTTGHRMPELALTANMAGTYAALRARILRLHKGYCPIGLSAGLPLAVALAALLPTWRMDFHIAIPEGFRPKGEIIHLNSDPFRFGSASVATMRTRTPKEGRP